MTSTNSSPTPATTGPITDTAPVAVIGLGSMGAALARAFLGAGTPTTVWNRTTARAEALAAEGADLAPDLAAAVEAGTVVVTCLRDHQATRELLGALPAEAFAGRTVVVLASSTPAEARETQAWADQRGIRALLGAIMVPTPLIGTPQSLILYAGRRDVLDRSRATLEVIAPNSAYVGDDPGLAPLLDTAMLEVFFAGMTAFLHASAMVTAHGLEAAAFLPWAKEMLAILPDTFDGLAADVDAGSYPGTEDNLAMELAALTHMVTTSRGARVDGRLPELMHDLARQAVDAGHGADGWSRVVEVLRGPGDRA